MYKSSSLQHFRSADPDHSDRDPKRRKEERVASPPKLDRLEKKEKAKREKERKEKEGKEEKEISSAKKEKKRVSTNFIHIKVCLFPSYV